MREPKHCVDHPRQRQSTPNKSRDPLDKCWHACGVAEDEARNSRFNKMIVRMVYGQQGSRPWRSLNRIVLSLLGVDIAPAAVLGSGLSLPHATAGLVIHPSVSIGKNVTIFHHVTLGRADAWSSTEAPGHGAQRGLTIGDGVVIAAGAIVLFHQDRPITIGSDAVIGANSVVTRSVPDGETWAGNPARRIGPKSMPEGDSV